MAFVIDEPEKEPEVLKGKWWEGLNYPYRGLEMRFAAAQNPNMKKALALEYLLVAVLREYRPLDSVKSLSVRNGIRMAEEALGVKP